MTYSESNTREGNRSPLRYSGEKYNMIVDQILASLNDDPKCKNCDYHITETNRYGLIVKFCVEFNYRICEFDGCDTCFMDMALNETHFGDRNKVEYQLHIDDEIVVNI